VTKAVVIDTSLLLLLIVGLTNPAYIDRHRRLSPVYKARHFDLIRNMALQAPKLLCTAHVLTETSNLLRQTSEPMRSEIMKTFKVFIGQAEEVVVSAAHATESPVFIRLGLTDAAVVSLDPRDMVLLTVDHDLHIASSERGFEVVNLTSYLHE